MEVKPRDADHFIARPPPGIRVVVLHGGDKALIRDRAMALARQICPDLTDPFRIIRLDGTAGREAAARMNDECRAVSMFGGRRVVWVEDFRDAQAEAVADLLGEPAWDALLVIEGGSLTKASKTIKAVNAAGDGATIACWEDSAEDFESYLRSQLRDAGVSGEPEVIDHLIRVLPRDRAMARGEIEKLVLYAGPEKRLSVADVTAMVGGGIDADIGSLCDAVFSGRSAEADQLLQRAWADDVQPVMVIRAAGEQLIRLREAALMIASGKSVDDAARSLRIHFSRTASFRSALRAWPAPRLSQAAGMLADAEADAKTSHLPSQAIVGRALLRIAAAAGRPRA